MKNRCGHLGITNAISRWQLSTFCTSEDLLVSLEIQLVFSVHSSSLANGSNYFSVPRPSLSF